jgi:hypothetical protein
MDALFSSLPVAALGAGFLIWRRQRSGRPVGRFAMALLGAVTLPALVTQSFALGRSEALKQQGCERDNQSGDTNDREGIAGRAVRHLGRSETKPTSEHEPRQVAAEVSVPRLAVTERQDGQTTKDKHADVSGGFHSISPAGLDSRRMPKLAGLNNPASQGGAPN